MQTFHFFRPVFTQRILQRLQQGEVLNLKGRDTEGASRLLQDIRQAQLEEVRLIYADLAAYPQRYNSFIQDLSQSLQLPEAVDDFDMLIEVLQLHGGRAILLFNHVDKVVGSDVDPHWQQDFFQALPKVQLAPALGMLLTSEGNIPWPAQTALPQQALPPFAYKRLREELLRAAPRLEDWNSLAQPIFAHPHRYLFLDYVTNELKAVDPVALAAPQALIETLSQDYAQLHDLGPIPHDSPKTPWWRRLFRAF